MKHPIRRRFMYLAFQGLQGVVSRLPLRLIRALGRFLGRAGWALLRGQRRLVDAHLDLALGGTHGPAQRRRIGREVFANLGQSALEWLALTRLSRGDLERLITAQGVEHLRAALAQGRGAIVVSAHFGNWELLAPYLIGLGFEGAVLARRLRYPEYESFLIGMRGAKGVPTLSRGSVKEAARLLRANQIVGLVPDQDVDSLEGVFVEFFGRPAYTPVGPAALSLMTGAPILPAVVIREGGAFRVVIEPALRVPRGDDRARALTQLTQAWSDALSAHIRAHPGQWAWMHRRWKTQPPAASDGRPTTGARPAASGDGQPEVGTEQPDDGGQRPAASDRRPATASLLACGFLLVAVLAGCAKRQEDKAPAPTADQEMAGFLLTGYRPDGSKRWDLRGQGATVEDDLVTILRPDGVGYEPDRTAYLTAAAATVHQPTRHTRLEHDVTIHTHDGIWFTTPVLHWIPDRDEVATDQPVRIETDHMLLRGRGFSGRTQLREATVQRDVEVVLNPTEQELSPALGGGQPGASKQVTITCDGPLSLDYERNIATFHQNVHVVDPSGDLYSDTLVAYLNPQTHTIRYAEAIGRVRIHQQRNTATSERAVYEPAIAKITLLGQPSLLLFPDDSGPEAAPSFGGLAAMSVPRGAPGEAEAGARR